MHRKMQRGGSGRSAGNGTSVVGNRRGTGVPPKGGNYPPPCSTHPSRRRTLARCVGGGATRPDRAIPRDARLGHRRLGVPDDRRERNRRSSIPTRLPVEAAQSSPPEPLLGKEINLPANRAIRRRPRGDVWVMTHRCDANGGRQRLSSLLRDLTRGMRAVVACAVLPRTESAASFKTGSGPYSYSYFTPAESRFAHGAGL